MIDQEDTIAAIATPHGKGGIAIVRVSGALALKAARIITGTTPKARTAYFRHFKYKNRIVDEGVLLYFAAPNSYTGEDVVEFQGHAGIAAPRQVLNAVLSIEGIRQAKPGEFTCRAFLNNKMDLTAAEAVEDLISANSAGAARAALSSLEGKFATYLNQLTAELTSLRARLEACLDFPEEHEDFFDSGKALDELNKVIAHAESAVSAATQGIRLSEGARIVLSGPPNAGKSSLLNALAGSERAIVTDIPGTTRDILDAEIEIQGIAVNITDTAGIRSTPADEIESIGISKALAELKKADLILLIIDGSSPAPYAMETLTKIREAGIDNDRILIVVSKADLKDDDNTRCLLEQEPFSSFQQVRSSAKVQGGLEELKQTLTARLNLTSTEGAFSARRRHLAELNLALNAIRNGREILKGGDLVLCARELREAQEHVGKITGKVTSDELLGKIFSTFCIGK